MSNTNDAYAESFDTDNVDTGLEEFLSSEKGRKLGLSSTLFDEASAHSTSNIAEKEYVREEADGSLSDQTQPELVETSESATVTSRSDQVTFGLKRYIMRIRRRIEDLETPDTLSKVLLRRQKTALNELMSQNALHDFMPNSLRKLTIKLQQQGSQQPPSVQAALGIVQVCLSDGNYALALNMLFTLRAQHPRLLMVIDNLVVILQELGWYRPALGFHLTKLHQSIKTSTLKVYEWLQVLQTALTQTDNDIIHHILDAMAIPMTKRNNVASYANAVLTIAVNTFKPTNFVKLCTEKDLFEYRDIQAGEYGHALRVFNGKYIMHLRSLQTKWSNAFVALISSYCLNQVPRVAYSTPFPRDLSVMTDYAEESMQPNELNKEGQFGYATLSSSLLPLIHECNAWSPSQSVWTAIMASVEWHRELEREVHIRENILHLLKIIKKETRVLTLPYSDDTLPKVVPPSLHLYLPHSLRGNPLLQVCYELAKVQKVSNVDAQKPISSSLVHQYGKEDVVLGPTETLLANMNITEDARCSLFTAAGLSSSEAQKLEPSSGISMHSMENALLKPLLPFHLASSVFYSGANVIPLLNLDNLEHSALGLLQVGKYWEVLSLIGTAVMKVDAYIAFVEVFYKPELDQKISMPDISVQDQEFLLQTLYGTRERDTDDMTEAYIQPGFESYTNTTKGWDHASLRALFDSAVHGVDVPDPTLQDGWSVKMQGMDIQTQPQQQGVKLTSDPQYAYERMLKGLFTSNECILPVRTVLITPAQCDRVDYPTACIAPASETALNLVLTPTIRIALYHALKNALQLVQHCKGDILAFEGDDIAHREQFLLELLSGLPSGIAQYKDSLSVCMNLNYPDNTLPIVCTDQDRAIMRGDTALPCMKAFSYFLYSIPCIEAIQTPVHNNILDKVSLVHTIMNNATLQHKTRTEDHVHTSNTSNTNNIVSQIEEYITSSSYKTNTNSTNTPFYTSMLDMHTNPVVNRVYQSIQKYTTHAKLPCPVTFLRQTQLQSATVVEEAFFHHHQTNADLHVTSIDYPELCPVSTSFHRHLKSNQRKDMALEYDGSTCIKHVTQSGQLAQVLQPPLETAALHTYAMQPGVHILPPTWVSTLTLALQSFHLQEYDIAAIYLGLRQVAGITECISSNTVTVSELHCLPQWNMAIDVKVANIEAESCIAQIKTLYNNLAILERAYVSANYQPWAYTATDAVVLGRSLRFGFGYATFAETARLNTDCQKAQHLVALLDQVEREMQGITVYDDTTLCNAAISAMEHHQLPYCECVENERCYLCICPNCPQECFPKYALLKSDSRGSDQYECICHDHNPVWNLEELHTIVQEVALFTTAERLSLRLHVLQVAKVDLESTLHLQRLVLSQVCTAAGLTALVLGKLVTIKETVDSPAQTIFMNSKKQDIRAYRMDRTNVQENTLLSLKFAALHVHLHSVCKTINTSTMKEDHTDTEEPMYLVDNGYSVNPFYTVLQASKEEVPALDHSSIERLLRDYHILDHEPVYAEKYTHPLANLVNHYTVLNDKGNAELYHRYHAWVSSVSRWVQPVYCARALVTLKMPLLPCGPTETLIASFSALRVLLAQYWSLRDTVQPLLSQAYSAVVQSVKDKYKATPFFLTKFIIDGNSIYTYLHSRNTLCTYQVSFDRIVSPQEPVSVPETESPLKQCEDLGNVHIANLAQEVVANNGEQLTWMDYVNSLVAYDPNALLHELYSLATRCEIILIPSVAYTSPKDWSLNSMMLVSTDIQDSTTRVSVLQDIIPAVTNTTVATCVENYTTALDASTVSIYLAHCLPYNTNYTTHVRVDSLPSSGDMIVYVAPDELEIDLETRLTVARLVSNQTIVPSFFNENTYPCTYINMKLPFSRHYTLYQCRLGIYTIHVKVHGVQFELKRTYSEYYESVTQAKKHQSVLKGMEGGRLKKPRAPRTAYAAKSKPAYIFDNALTSEYTNTVSYVQSNLHALIPLPRVALQTSPLQKQQCRVQCGAMQSHDGITVPPFEHLDDLQILNSVYNNSNADFVCGPMFKWLLAIIYRVFLGIPAHTETLCNQCVSPQPLYLSLHGVKVPQDLLSHPIMREMLEIPVTACPHCLQAQYQTVTVLIQHQKHNIAVKLVVPILVETATICGETDTQNIIQECASECLSVDHRLEHTVDCSHNTFSAPVKYMEETQTAVYSSLFVQISMLASQSLFLTGRKVFSRTILLHCLSIYCSRSSFFSQERLPNYIGTPLAYYDNVQSPNVEYFPCEKTAVKLQLHKISAKMVLTDKEETDTVTNVSDLAKFPASKLSGLAVCGKEFVFLEPISVVLSAIIQLIQSFTADLAQEFRLQKEGYFTHIIHKDGSPEVDHAEPNRDCPCFYSKRFGKQLLQDVFHRISPWILLGFRVFTHEYLAWRLHNGELNHITLPTVFQSLPMYLTFDNYIHELQLQMKSLTVVFTEYMTTMHLHHLPPKQPFSCVCDSPGVYKDTYFSHLHWKSLVQHTELQCKMLHVELTTLVLAVADKTVSPRFANIPNNPVAKFSLFLASFHGYFSRGYRAAQYFSVALLSQQTDVHADITQSYKALATQEQREIFESQFNTLPWEQFLAMTVSTKHNTAIQDMMSIYSNIAVLSATQLNIRRSRDANIPKNQRDQDTLMCLAYRAKALTRQNRHLMFNFGCFMHHASLCTIAAKYYWDVILSCPTDAQARLAKFNQSCMYRKHAKQKIVDALYASKQQYVVPAQTIYHQTRAQSVIKREQDTDIDVSMLFSQIQKKFKYSK